MSFSPATRAAALEVVRAERARFAAAPAHHAVVLVDAYLAGLEAELEAPCTPPSPLPPASTPKTCSASAPTTATAG